MKQYPRESSAEIGVDPSKHIDATICAIDEGLFAVESDDVGEDWLRSQLEPLRLPPLGAEDPIAATLLDQNERERYEAYIKKRDDRLRAALGAAELSIKSK